ncbi:response regulator transcription factor [Novosphingobium sp. JCM 18896]|nr:response regulator transcription factor [Novosphingobium sp. JCM 18896]
MRLLLVEDDGHTAGEVLRGMRERGHSVEHAEDVERAGALLETRPFDVIIVDRMLPDGDGLILIKRLRARENGTPALALTAMGRIADRVEGLKAGADDYLVKPFSLDELEARVEALARRVSAVRLVIGDLVLDRLTRTVHRGSTRIALMPREFQLLELLMASSPAVVTRTMLLERVWEFHFDPGTNLVEAHVSRLRSKIDRGGDPPLIHTVRGEGYVALAR